MLVNQRCNTRVPISRCCHILSRVAPSTSESLVWLGAALVVQRYTFLLWVLAAAACYSAVAVALLAAGGHVAGTGCAWWRRIEWCKCHACMGGCSVLLAMLLATVGNGCVVAEHCQGSRGLCCYPQPLLKQPAAVFICAPPPRQAKAVTVCKQAFATCS
jgi:hypothetical protein